MDRLTQHPFVKINNKSTIQVEEALKKIVLNLAERILDIHA